MKAYNEKLKTNASKESKDNKGAKDAKPEVKAAADQGSEAVVSK